MSSSWGEVRDEFRTFNLKNVTYINSPDAELLDVDTST